MEPLEGMGPYNYETCRYYYEIVIMKLNLLYLQNFTDSYVHCS